MPICHRDSFGTVYVAWTGETHQGPLKVGFTCDVERRMRQLSRDVHHRVALIASAPGSRIQEQHLIDICAEHRNRLRHRQSREFFHDSALNVLAPAWERMFGVLFAWPDRAELAETA